MKKNIYFTFLSLFLFLSISAQDSVGELVSKGVALHDQGKFDQAISAYKTALKMDKNSTLAMYEMAFSYMEKGDYKNAVKWSSKVIKKKEDNMLASYIINGSALDMMGKTKKGIEVLEKAAKDFPDAYLVHFNLGVNYSQVNETEKAINSFKNAINVNPEHGTSHLFLGHLQIAMNRKSKAALSYYFFLLLEPDTDRSDIAYKNLIAIMNPKPDQNGTFNITLSMDDEGGDPFWTTTDLIIATLGTISDSKDMPDMTDAEKFAMNTTTFFSMFNEDDKEKESEYKAEREKDFYWKTYIPIFASIHKIEAVKPFAYFISQNQGDEYVKWLDDNADEVKKLLNIFK